MRKENLEKYKSITIVRENTSEVASLHYSVTKNSYAAEMPASHTVGTILAESITLTDELIGHIIEKQDGAIQLSV